MYKVINRFKDTDGKVYDKNDKYNSIDKGRLHVLSTTENKYNKVFIIKVDEDDAEGVDVTDMTVSEIKEVLDQLDVEYKANAKKDELITLLESVKTPEKEGD